MIELIKSIVPDSLKKKYHAAKQKKLKDRIASLPKINENEFQRILTEDLNIRSSDLVMIHSSIDRLNLSFSSLKVLDLILEVVGENGTVIFPTFPKLNSYKFLSTNSIFKHHRTPSYMGLLSELARRHTKAVRSIHPTKSVVAIGQLAEEICSEHQDSILPYDRKSPFYKLYENNAKAIGIGVKTTFFSALHVIDDLIPEKMPIDPYHKEVFEGKCVLKDGSEFIVITPAHDMKKMHFDLPKFFNKHIPKEIAKDIRIKGSDYFTANVKELFDLMFKLADNGITIYKF